MPRKKKQSEAITAEVTYSSKVEAPKPEPLIVPATSIPEKVERVAEPKPGGIMIKVPDKFIPRDTRWECQSCGYINAKRDTYCQANPDHCKAPKGNG